MPATVPLEGLITTTEQRTGKDYGLACFQGLVPGSQHAAMRGLNIGSFVDTFSSHLDLDVDQVLPDGLQVDVNAKAR